MELWAEGESQSFHQTSTGNSLIKCQFLVALLISPWYAFKKAIESLVIMGTAENDLKFPRIFKSTAFMNWGHIVAFFLL